MIQLVQVVKTFGVHSGECISNKCIKCNEINCDTCIDKVFQYVENTSDILKYI